MTSNPDLYQRLDALPPKTALPFRQLLAGGQIDEDTVSMILDAGELSGDHSRLLGFALAYMHLRAQSVPVHDVIRMAKNQKRRINLAWSPARWKTEHDRLSRSEALERLARENVAYDVSRFEALLPERFDGYLIRTSRRLGMEGLRQRHCVAAYHPQLQAGTCAIAAVFVDRQRWTVQLAAMSNPKALLRINQIKTRLNGLPSAAVRNRIHEMLGIETAVQAGSPDPVQDGESSYLEALRRLLPVLREAGVRNVTVEFEGYNDSGAIEDIQFDPELSDDVKHRQVEIPKDVRHFEDGRWVRATELTRCPVNEAIETIAYDYLEETGVDWYNNDGGFGRLEIDVAQGTVELEVNVRYTDSTCEFHAERDILTGEEI